MWEAVAALEGKSGTFLPKAAAPNSAMKLSQLTDRSDRGESRSSHVFRACVFANHPINELGNSAVAPTVPIPGHRSARFLQAALRAVATCYCPVARAP